MPAGEADVAPAHDGEQPQGPTQPGQPAVVRLIAVTRDNLLNQKETLELTLRARFT